MHSDRLPEESKRALRTVLEGLRRLATQSRKPAEEQEATPPPTTQYPYALLQYLLASAKPPREDQDTIDDIHECFGGPKLEPVLPHRPAEPVDRWDLMASSMRLADAEFVERHKPEIKNFRQQQVRIYWMYVKSLRRDCRSLYGKMLNLTMVSGESDAFELHGRRIQMEWLFIRLRFAGAVYLVNGAAGERMSNEVLAQLRPTVGPMFSTV